MKITDVEMLPYDAAFRDMVFVKLAMDAGIHRWGEAGGMRHERACEAAVPAFKPYFIGPVESAQRAARCSAAVSPSPLQ